MSLSRERGILIPNHSIERLPNRLCRSITARVKVERLFITLATDR